MCFQALQAPKDDPGFDQQHGRKKSTTLYRKSWCSTISFVLVPTGGWLFEGRSMTLLKGKVQMDYWINIFFKIDVDEGIYIAKMWRLGLFSDVFCNDSHCPNDVTRSVFAMATGGGGRGSATTPGFSRGAEIPVETLFVWRWEGWLNTISWER